MKRLLGIGRRVVQRSGQDDAGGLATQLAWSFLLAVFPFGIFAAALVGVVAGALGVHDATARILGALGDNLPTNLVDLIRPELASVIQRSQPGILSLGAIGALWAATGGTMTLVKAMNLAYDVPETRNIVLRYARGVVLTLLATVGMVASFVTIVGGSLVTQDVAARLGFGDGLWTVLSVLRWPLVFLVLVAAVTLLFRLAPNVAAPWRWSAAGAAVFAIGWLVATYVFAFYVANFGRYGATYGSLGGVVVLMVWFYVSSLLLVLSAEIVAALTAELSPGRLAGRQEELGAAPVTTPPSEAGAPSTSPGRAPAPDDA